MKKFSRHMAYLIAATLLLYSGRLQAEPPGDPGVRPPGNTPVTFGPDLGLLRGPSIGQGTASTPFLHNAILDVAQPPDPNAGGNEGAGRVLSGLDAVDREFWWSGLAIFGMNLTPDGLNDDFGNQTIKGLGPSFNGRSCFMCHSFPAIGGTAPPANPQVALANERGATNSVPPFITSDGPIREVRFQSDSGVHDLFTITGRSDSVLDPSLPPCSATQPDFSNTANLSFRIPTPTFGVGLVEAVSDDDLIANLNNFSATKSLYGISGSFNRNGNDGTITRFGWKAQNKSLLLFAGEAANVELGLTNELFPNERVHDPCIPHGIMEDNTHDTNVFFPGHGLNEGTSDADIAGMVSSAIENFAVFMRLNGAPSQCRFDSGTAPDPIHPGRITALCLSINDGSTSAQSIERGEDDFRTIGCVLCHSEQLTTSGSDQRGLAGGRTFEPFSDFALHHMGDGLADGITQGLAGSDQFRTAPLWGLGQRFFLLHDGRCVSPDAQNPTRNALECAIEAHNGNGSEAASSISQFEGSLNDAQKQDLYNFLRSL